MVAVLFQSINIIGNKSIWRDGWIRLPNFIIGGIYLNKKKTKNANKTYILLREKVLDEKEKQLDETIQEYKELISEVKELKQKYLEAVKGVNKIKIKYEKEMEAQLQRIRKQK